MDCTTVGVQYCAEINFLGYNIHGELRAFQAFSVFVFKYLWFVVLWPVVILLLFLCLGGVTIFILEVVRFWFVDGDENAENAFNGIFRIIGAGGF